MVAKERAYGPFFFGCTQSDAARAGPARRLMHSLPPRPRRKNAQRPDFGRWRGFPSPFPPPPVAWSGAKRNGPRLLGMGEAHVSEAQLTPHYTQFTAGVA